MKKVIINFQARNWILLFMVNIQVYLLDLKESKNYQDIWETNEDIGLKILFYEQVPLKEFYEFDIIYSQIQNLEAFINNGAIKIDIIKYIDSCIRPSFMQYISQMDVSSELALANNEEEEAIRIKAIIDEHKELLIKNREDWGRIDSRYYNVSLSTWEKDTLVLKAWAKKFPFFPEYYVQMQNASEQVNNESYYLEELFGEKEYPSIKGTEDYKEPINSNNQSNNQSNSILFVNNRSYNSTSKIGRRYASTLSNNPLNTIKSNYKIGSETVNEFLKEKNLIPVFVYENLKEDNIKRRISEETKGLSGIYLILNKVTKDYYIGSASTNRLYIRFSNHLIHFTGSKVVKHAVKKI